MVLVSKIRHILRRTSISRRIVMRLSTKAAVQRVEEDPMADFQLLVEQRQANEALRIFNSLKKPPSIALAQRLAIMLAKKSTLKDTKASLEVLKTVYMNTSLKPDDYTKLAFIYVSDACFRSNMIQEALEVTEEAHNLGIRLDLPAYNNLINALVESDQTDEAMLILQDIAAGDVISPDETTYSGLIEAIISQREFSQATEIINQARTTGVKFSSNTYMSFMTMLAEVEDDSAALENLLSYLDSCMEEDGVEAMAGFDDEFDMFLANPDDDDDTDDDADGSTDDDSDDEDDKGIH